MENKFEHASRTGLRYTSKRGYLSTEDLWNLPLNHSSGIDLENVAVTADTELEKSGGKRFTSSKITDPLPELRMDIIKHIIGIKLAEKATAASATANKAQKQKVLAAIAGKEDDALAGKSIEELKALAASM